MTKTLRVALLVSSCAASAVADRPPASPPDPDAPGLQLSQRLEALLERVKYEQGKLMSLEAEFVQEKASEFLASPETSRGTVTFVSPDRVRWEYLTPKPISLVIRADEMLTWYRDLGRAERVKVERLSSQALQYLSASGSLESLLRYFRASVSFPHGPEPYRVELVPRFARVARRLASMTLWIDREIYLPTRVRYVEPSGDVTEYRLENVRVNPVVPDEAFELVLPPDVEVREIDLDAGRARSGGAPGS